MLVLSRKPNQKVLFPAIGASVEVVAIKGNVVRLGIEAPPGVAVFREELIGRDGAPPPAPPPEGLPRELAHALRNRLNSATLGLAVLRKQRELGLSAESGPTLDSLDREVEALRQQVEGAARAAPAPEPPAVAPRRRRVLLVEDDANERELLAGLLRLFGLEVVTASDGIDALESLRGGAAPDAVLLDMGLPRCDGSETVRQIRLDPARAGLKVFAVTGRAAEEFGGGGAAAFDGWFQKPVNPQHLLRELERELAGVS